MTANVGTADRLTRLILGLLLIGAPLINLFGIWANSVFAYSSMGVGAILVATAIFGFCPLYRLLGLSTA